jgi:hypothetical protein
VDRKQSLTASLRLGGACGVRAADPADPAPTDPAAPPLTPCDEKAEFARTWIRRFMETLDREVAEPDRVALMEARGQGRSRRRSHTAATSTPFWA